MKREKYLPHLLALAALAAAVRAQPAGEGCVNCHRGWPELKEWGESAHAAAGVGCPDCHGGDVNAASMDAVRRAPGYVGVFPRDTVPRMCARCHSDAGAMKQYDLPFNQYDEYITSVHGLRLAAGDLKVAVCSDCHGAHLVLPASEGRSSVNKMNVPATCRKCHGDEALMAQYGLPADTYELYARSVHGRMLLEQQITGVPSCADCHGNHGAAPPGVDEVVNVCGHCHVNQRQYYRESPHATAGPEREACVTCHGHHLIAKPDDTLYVGSQPGACGSCHERGSSAYRLARGIADSFAGAKGAVEEARGRLEEARVRAIPVGRWEQQLNEAEAKITEAYPVAHSLSLAKINDLGREAVVGAHGVEGEIAFAFRERGRRKEILVFCLGLTLLVILLLGLKWRRLFKEL
ncbi:MAG: hypothetical protein GTN49_05840 [candidate division Zixibacteria bacterium]|nr:hypothetical protein [candidate division Zixibacteria bacterium]